MLKHCESPPALDSATTRDGISSYSFMICSFGTEYHRALELSQISFLLLGYLSQLIFMASQTSCVEFKSRESPRHSKTDVSLITRIFFCTLRINTKNITLYK